MLKTMLVPSLLLALWHGASAQSCSANQVLMKNDNLAAILTFPWPATAVTTLGLGEAAACIFDVSTVSPVVRVSSAAVAFINGFGTSGIQAPANLEIYDGLAWSGTIPILGPKVFDYAVATGGPVTLTTNMINVTDLSGFGVQVCSGKLVVAWRLLARNLGATNIPVDCTSGGGFSCNLTTTVPMKNLVFHTATGSWRDVTATIHGGLPFCPFFYCGNWQIRACVEPTAFVDTISLSGSPISSPGVGGVLFQFPSHPNKAYVGGAAFSVSPGIPTPIGVVPLADDALLAISLVTPSIFSNFAGQLDASGTASGTIIVPGGVPPLTAYVAAVAWDPGSSQILAISNAAAFGVW
jgi:hypothetical protein